MIILRSQLLSTRNDACESLVKRYKDGERTKNLLRNIQQYAVNVYETNYKALFGAGHLEILDDELAVLRDLDRYSEKTGLDASADSGEGIFV